MSVPLTVLILFAAALLEAGGDALVRHGLHGAGARRLLFFFEGACVLFSYGYVVNSPPWNFGDLLGVYVVLFFLAAQLMAYFFFGDAPSKTTLLGGVFIVIGGLIISAGHLD